MPDEIDTQEQKPRVSIIGRAWRMEWISSPRLRVFARVGVVALVVTLLVLIPGYIALQPAFVQRYANLSPAHSTWSTSVHAQVSCQQCHVSPRPTAQAAYAARMIGEFYLSLVARNRTPEIYSRPTNAACESCHIDLRTVSPRGDLNIPHRAHVSVLKMECVKCHQYLVHEKSPEGKHTPTMASCLTCHDGKLAKNSCSTCHTAKAIPDSHKAANWTAVHAQMQDKVDCKPCHAWTENWCADCHARRPRDHGPDWRAKHGDQVKKHRNCEACHQAAFCVRCHGEVPQTNFNPALQVVR